MKITKYGHATFLIEDGLARILLDPGAMSTGFEKLGDLSAIIYTHHHSDHYDAMKLKGLARINPKAVILADVDTARMIRVDDYNVQAMRAGDKAAIRGTEIEAFGADHAVIHPDVRLIANIGYLFGGRFFYPGDALLLPDRPIELLALPVVAPWTKVWEVVEYLREVKPDRAIPAHEAVAAIPEMYYGMIERLTEQSGIEFRRLELGEVLEI